MLFIKHLTLQNFMSIENMDLDLNHKTILISGANGSGKSSILDALALAFTTKKRSTSYQDYVKQGKEFAKIIIDCIVNNKSAHFDIQLNLVKGTAYQIALTYDGQTYNNKECDPIIESFDLGYYSDLVFSMQSESDITQLTPAQRAYYLQKLLNFDFEEQKIKLKKELDQFDDILKTNNTELPLKQKFVESEKNLVERLKVVKETPEEIQEISKNIFIKEDELKKSEEKLEQLSELNKQLNEINSNLQKHNNKNTELSFKLKSINNDIENAKNANKQILALKEEKNKELEKQKQITELFKNKDTEVQEVETELRELNENKPFLLELETEINRLEKLYHDDNCPYCGQETKDAAEGQYLSYIKSKNIGNLLNNLSSIDGCKTEIFEKLLELNKEIDKKTAEVIQERKKLEIISYDCNNIKDSLKNLDNSILYYHEELNKIKLNESHLEKCNEEIKHNNSLIAMYNDQKQKISEQIAEFSSIKISQINKEIEELKNIVYNYTNTLNTNEEIKKRNQKRQENITSLQKEVEELQLRNVEILKQKDTYEEAYKIFDKDLPNFMSIKACSTLQDNINDFIQNIFPDYEVSLQASKKGCEFFYTKNSSIQESGKKNNYLINSKMSSGFEKNLLTLAFKISLAKLYSCDCLFLDEADGASSEENAMKLFNNIFDDSFSQIFVITHKEAVKEHLINNFSVHSIEIADGAVI